MKDLDGFYLGISALVALSGTAAWLLFRRRDPLKLSKTAFLVGWNALLTFFLFGLVFWAGESYYRFFVDTTDSFALNKISIRWGERHYQGNNLGFRDDHDYSLTPARPGRRISFMGDSFTAGHGVKKARDRFTNHIQAWHPEWVVHNIGANGYESDNHVAQLQDLLAQGYALDVLVLVYNLNDISYLVPQTALIYDRIFAFKDQLNFWERNSYLVNTLSFRSYAGSDPDFLNYYDYLSRSYTGQTWEQQQNTLNQLISICREKGITLRVVTFPFLQNIKEYAFTNAHTQLDAFWKSKGIPHFDLLPVFRQHADEDLTVNAYDAHPNEYAHKIASEAIRSFLENSLRQP